MDRQTDMVKIIVAFRNFADAFINVKLSSGLLYLRACFSQVSSVLYCYWCLLLAFIEAETCSTIDNEILLK